MCDPKWSFINIYQPWETLTGFDFMKIVLWKRYGSSALKIKVASCT